MHSGYSSKHDIPLDHLDFAYITGCSDVKELEKILKVLRSRDEGCFPDLERHCEEKLSTVAPNNRLLRKVTPLARGEHLPASELNSLNQDINSWTDEMSELDAALKTKESRSTVQGDSDNVPVRQTQTFGEMNGECETRKETPKKRVLPRGYAEWDKLNIDEELAKVDTKDDEREAVPSSTPHRLPDIIDDLSMSGMKDKEKGIRADREKDKGNEAFKAGDFEESVLYYSRSISLRPSTHAYNNRALSYLKLSKWKCVIRDCRHVLKDDPDNIKALMRCGSAYRGKKDWKRAVAHLNHVLSLEPSNKKALDLLAEIENERTTPQPVPTAAPTEAKGHRMVIEEVDGDESDGDVTANRKSGESGDMTQSTKVTNDHSVSGILASKDSQKSEDITEVNIESNVDDKFDENVIVDQKDSECDIGKNITIDERRNGEMDVDKLECTTEEGGQIGGKISVGNDCEDDHDGQVSSKSSEIQGELKRGDSDDEEKVVKSVETQNALNERLENRLVTKERNTRNAKDTDPPETEIPALLESSEPNESTTTSPHEIPTSSRPVFDKNPLRPDIENDKATGNASFRAGQFPEAMKKYTAAIAKLENERDCEVHLSTLYTNRAMCHLKVGDAVAAIRDCDTALRFLPHSLKPLLRRANANEQLERHSDALRDYKHVQLLDNTVALAFEGSSRCFAAIKELYGLKWSAHIKPMPVVQSHEIPLIIDHSVKAPDPGTPSPAATPCVEKVKEKEEERVEQKDEGKVEMTNDELFEKWKFEGNSNVRKEWSYIMRRDMQEIIPGLYLGPYGVALKSNLIYLKQRDITHIVCIRHVVESHFIRPNSPSHFQYLVLDIADSVTENIITHFSKVKDFIDNCLSGGGRCLVHANAGISRSAALVIAYLMERFRQTFRETFAFVQQKRFCINPNEGFTRQLQEYEVMYKAKQDTLYRNTSSNTGSWKRKYRDDESCMDDG